MAIGTHTGCNVEISYLIMICFHKFFLGFDFSIIYKDIKILLKVCTSNYIRLVCMICIKANFLRNYEVWIETFLTIKVLKNADAYVTTRLPWIKRLTKNQSSIYSNQPLTKICVWQFALISDIQTTSRIMHCSLFNMFRFVVIKQWGN